MSLNRENVTWLSPRDGLWYRGFYDFYDVGDPEDRDPEWDVEYNFDSFNWVTKSGYATEEAAYAAWTGANPGGGDITSDPAEGKVLDEMRDKVVGENKAREAMYKPRVRW